MEYREVISAPLWLIAFVYFIFLSIVLSIWAVFDTRVTLTTLAVSTLALIWIAISMKSEITFDGNILRIDSAKIERKYLGQVTVLDRAAMRLLRTRDADPAAYLAIKFWMPKGIKITVVDPRDPTPYWLITSKRGEEIAALLDKS